MKSKAIGTTVNFSIISYNHQIAVIQFNTLPQSGNHMNPKYIQGKENF